MEPSGPAPSDATRTATGGTRPSLAFGPYRLLQPLGEGGMGEVWLAEQMQPVRRQVALKIIKAGMDTAQVVARFEAERQALALMDHPAIATVFDGGSTPEGRPYFAMEYVKGEPITTYCDRLRLGTKERLALFILVCEGVQHAHQKGIIHRDLKPSNVLVTLQDDHPVPKIIDFGVAKATTQHLTERTMASPAGTRAGTTRPSPCCSGRLPSKRSCGGPTTRTYRHMGRHAEAEPLSLGSLTTWQKALGPDHPYVGVALRERANLFWDQGKLAEAAPLYARSLALFQRRHEEEEEKETLDNYLPLLRKIGRAEEAVLLEKRLESIRAGIPGKG